METSRILTCQQDEKQRAIQFTGSSANCKSRSLGMLLATFQQVRTYQLHKIASMYCMMSSISFSSDITVWFGKILTPCIIDFMNAMDFVTGFAVSGISETKQYWVYSSMLKESDWHFVQLLQGLGQKPQRRMAVACFSLAAKYFQNAHSHNPCSPNILSFGVFLSCRTTGQTWQFSFGLIRSWTQLAPWDNLTSASSETRRCYLMDACRTFVDANEWTSCGQTLPWFLVWGFYLSVIGLYKGMAAICSA